MNDEIPYTGTLPTHWRVIQNRFLFYYEGQKVGDAYNNYQLLSLTTSGVKKRDINSSGGKVPASYDNYQTVKRGQLVFCLFDLDCSAVFSGISNYDGMITSAYDVYSCNEKMNNGYSDYWFKYVFSNRYYKMFSKSIRYTITGEMFRSLKTPVPPIEEQRSISSFLLNQENKIDTLIQNVQTQIEKLKAYKQSLITEVVTRGLNPTVPMKDSGVDWIGKIPEHWSVAALKYFTDILPGYAFSSNDFHTETGIPLLRGVNVTPNGVRWEDTVYWNKEIADNLKPFILQHDDIVVGLDRPWISEGTRITRIKEKDLPSLLLQRVCRIRVKGFMDSRWVFLWIASNAFKESLSTETTGISVPHISTKQIGDFIVAIPPMEVQKEICEFIDAKCVQIDRLIAIKQAKIEKLEQYKRSLIYEYVTGKKEVV